MAGSVEPKVAHMVYFTLKDNSAPSIEKLVAACQKYLVDHPGVVFFGVGTRIPDLTRDVNDQEFHVGLHVVFENRAAHDVYQTSPRHLQFIDENKATWAKVRVCDTDLW